MVNYREILRLRSLGYSQRKVAVSVQSSRDTISEVYKLADEKALSWPLATEWSNTDLRNLLYPEKTLKGGRKMPDLAYLHKELAKPNVTLTLLWSEYCECCQAEGLIPYQYTQFCDYYRSYALKTKATMRIKRKPVELLEVDWAGSTLSVYDDMSGEAFPAYIFVACLPCSLYSYAEAFPSMAMEHWINAHIHAYQFFGGVTRILTPDNLKNAVTKHGRTEVLLNRVYQEMAEHYNTAVIPARPASPKDKPNAEGTVGIISTWIIAALRNEKFFSFPELNVAIQKKLLEFNAKPFQKKNGSRFSAFEEEKSFLQALPASPYEMAVWSTAKIQPDYLITVEKNKYSVPFEFIGHEVDIRYTSKTIEVFFQNNRIASHVRRYGSCDPEILPEHMPENHRKYLAYNKEAFLEWAESVGKATLIVMKSFLDCVKVEQQGYKTCASLMKLANRYAIARIEDACARALTYTASPSLKNIQTILKTGKDRVNPENTPGIPRPSGKYGFTRGAEYFGGERHD
jgi:transposase